MPSCDAAERQEVPFGMAVEASALCEMEEALRVRYKFHMLVLLLFPGRHVVPAIGLFCFTLSIVSALSYTRPALLEFNSLTDTCGGCAEFLCRRCSRSVALASL